MKHILSIILQSALVALLTVSCKDNEPTFGPNEFSDVSFINSHKVDEFGSVYIDAGAAVNFADLSHNAISHVWEISEGCHFLGGDYSVEDENLSNFIINSGATTSTDSTIGVLFEEPGEKKVRLFNLFNSPVSYTGFEGNAEVTINSMWMSEYNAHVFDYAVDFIVLDKVQAAYRVYRGADTSGELLLEVGVDDVVDSESSSEIHITAGESLTFEVHEDCELSRYNEVEWTFAKGEPIISPSTNAKVVTVTYPIAGTGPSPLGALAIKRNSSNNSNFKLTEMSNSKLIPLTLVVSAPSQTEQITLSESNVSSLSGDNFLKIDLGTYIDEDSDLIAAVNDFEITAIDWKGDAIQLDITKIELDKSSDDLDAQTTKLIVTFGDNQKLYADDDITKFSYVNRDNIRDEYGRTIADFDLEAVETHIENLILDWVDTLHTFEDGGEYNTQSTHRAFMLTTDDAYEGKSLYYSPENAMRQGPESIASPAALVYYIGSNAKSQPILFEANQNYLCTFKVKFEKGLGDDKLQMRVKTATGQKLTDIVFDFDTEDPANWGKWLDASVVITYVNEDFDSSLSLRFAKTYTEDVPDAEFYIDNIAIYKDGKTTRAHDEYGLGLGDIEGSGDL